MEFVVGVLDVTKLKRINIHNRLIKNSKYSTWIDLILFYSFAIKVNFQIHSEDNYQYNLNDK